MLEHYYFLIQILNLFELYYLEGSLMSVQTPLTGRATIDKVTERCAEEAGWQNTAEGWKLVNLPAQDEANPHLKRGIGFACGFKNTGFSFGYQENSWARVEIHGETEIERVVVHHGAADVGQGTHTVIMQAVAEATGAEFEQVEFIGADSDIKGDSGSSSASRMTFMALNSVKGAGERALEKWQNEERPAIAEYKYLAPKTTPYDPETGKSTPNVAYGHCAQVAAAGEGGLGGFLRGPGFGFAVRNFGRFVSEDALGLAEFCS